MIDWVDFSSILWLLEPSEDEDEGRTNGEILGQLLISEIDTEEQLSLSVIESLAIVMSNCLLDN